MTINGKSTILVVGDWLVDEDWVTGIHRSMTSARTGQAHYRGLNPMHTQDSFCGAGKTAAILYNARKKEIGRNTGDGDDNSSLFNIIGIGAWHRDDTDELSMMLAEQGGTEHRPDKLTRSARSESCRNSGLQKNIQLINLADILFDNQNICDNDNKENDFGTTRVIRIYQKSGKKTELIQRIDWEAQSRLASIYWEDKDNQFEITKKLETAILNSIDIMSNGSNSIRCGNRKELFNSIDAIVIKDMLKGVITDKLIGWLKNSFTKAHWYISTKKWRPNWYAELIGKSEVKLVIIPGAAVDEVVREGKNNLTTWINHKGHVSQEALELLEELRSAPNNSSCDQPTLITVLPHRHQLLALGSGNVIIQSKPFITQELPSLETPFASLFFSAMIALGLGSSYGERERLDCSLRYSVKCEAEHINRIERQYRGSSLKDPILYLDCRESNNEYSPKWNDDRGFDDHINDWINSKEKLGIIESENRTGNPSKKDKILDYTVKGTLQLWRAMTEIDGYVCIETSKRKKLQKLVQYLKAFKTSKSKRSQSIMLYAPPGSGKSYLVKCLANALGYYLLPFNVTQMFSKADLLDCFDSITTFQAQNPNERIIVFIDEINAEIQNQSIYDTFLAPLEDGYYIRAEKIFHIMPCIWIFAGTDNPREQTQERDVKASSDRSKNNIQKFSDFQSRLTFKCNLRIGDEELDPYLLERNINNPDENRLTTAAAKLIEYFNVNEMNRHGNLTKGNLKRLKEFSDINLLKELLALLKRQPRINDLDGLWKDYLNEIEIFSKNYDALKEIRLERIYSGISLIRNEFPDVNYISDYVLAMLKRFPLTKSKREMGHFIRSFKNIQYSIVVWDNVPKNNLSEYYPENVIRNEFIKWDKKNEYLIRIED